MMNWIAMMVLVGSMAPADKLPRSTPADAPADADPDPFAAPPPSAAPADTPTASPPPTDPAADAPESATPLEPSPSGEPAPSTAPAAPGDTTVVTASAPAPRPPRPIRWRLDFSLGAGATFVTDDAFLGLSDARSILGAAPQVRFDWRLRPAGYLFIGGGAMYRGTRRAGSINDTLNTSLQVDEPIVFARLSLMPTEGVDVFADLGVGPSFTRIDVEDTAFENFATQRNVLVAADAMAGLSLYLPKKWLPRKAASRVTAGLTGSLGYTIRNTLTVAPELDREDDSLPTRAPTLGDVAMRGLSWRAGLFIRFM